MARGGPRQYARPVRTQPAQAGKNTFLGVFHPASIQVTPKTVSPPTLSKKRHRERCLEAASGQGDTKKGVMHPIYKKRHRPK